MIGEPERAPVAVDRDDREENDAGDRDAAVTGESLGDGVDGDCGADGCDDGIPRKDVVGDFGCTAENCGGQLESGDEERFADLDALGHGEWASGSVHEVEEPVAVEVGIVGQEDDVVPLVHREDRRETNSDHETECEGGTSEGSVRYGWE